MTKKKPDFLQDLDTAIMDELTGGGIKGNAAGLVGTLTQIKEIKQLYGIMRAARKKGMGKGAGVSGEVYGRTAGHRRTGRGQHHRQRRGTQDTGKIRIIRT